MVVKSPLAIMVAILTILSCSTLMVQANSFPAAAASSQPDIKGDHARSDWAGLWIGVEGFFVFVTLTEPGVYQLEMKGETDDPKDVIILSGRDTEEGIVFERDGKNHLLKSATGEEIGLKWLLDKKDCLMVEEYEGFCRD